MLLFSYLIRTFSMSLLFEGVLALAINSSSAVSNLDDMPNCQLHTRLVGDGSPYQSVLNLQVTQRQHCSPHNTCGVGYNQGVSYSISWSSTISPASWISGGFSVTETTSKSESHSCNGEDGEIICVWAAIQHTTYKVHDVWNNGKCGGPGPEYTITSPNTDNKGGDFYCVVGTCRDLNGRWWDDHIRDGGP